MKIAKMRKISPWTAMLVLLILTFLTWLLVSASSRERVEERFQYRTGQILLAITQKMKDYAVVLQGGAALFGAYGDVTRNEWRTYVGNLDIDSAFPGIQGIGFSGVIQPADLMQHIQQIRAEGFSDYTVWPEGEREVYTSIIFLEPFDVTNQRDFGFDMYSDLVRQAAMQQARDTAAASISSKVTLVQETEQDVQAGFLMYVPVYTNSMTTNSVEGRRAALQGFVYSPFHIRNFIQGILQEQQSDIDIEIYDGTEVSSSTLMYSSNEADSGLNAGSKPMFFDYRTIDLNGHPWTFYFATSPSIETASVRFGSWGICAIGTVISLLAFLFIRGKKGNYERALVLAQEMASTRQEGQEELGNSKTVYHDLTNLSPEAVFLTDTEGIILAANETIALLLGKNDQVMIGANFFDLLPPTVAIERKAYTDQVISSGKPVRFEDYHAGRAIDNYILPIFDRDGKLTWLAYFSIDFTERKLAEERLKESEERFHSAFEYAAIGKALVEPDGRWFRVNRALSEMLGYTEDDLLKKTFQDITHPDDLEVDFVYGHQMLTGDIQSYQIEKRFFHKNGQIVWGLLSMSLVRDKEGQPLYFISQIQDITERKRAEQVQEALYAISQAAVTTENLQDLFLSIHLTLGNLMPTKNFYIAFYDPDADLISFPYFVDEYDDIPMPHQPGRGLTEYVLRTGRPLLADQQTFVQLVQEGEVELVGADSLDWMGAPLKVGAKVFGVLVVQNFSESVRLGTAALEMLEFVSTQMANAIARKLDQQRISDALAFNNLLIDASTLGISAYNSTGQCVLTNKTTARILGTTTEQVLGQNYHQIESWKKLGLLEAAHEAASSGNNTRREIHTISTFGKEIWLDCRFAPFISNGEPQLLLTIDDISITKQAEEQLRQSEEQYRNTLESMLEGCQIIGYDWRYLFINSSAAIQGRQNKEEFLGHTMMEIYPGIENTDLFATLQRCMDERTPHQMVNQFIYSDGSSGWFELSIQPTPDGIFILSNDITERIYAEKEQRNNADRAAMLAEISKSLADMTSNPQAMLELIAQCVTELIGDATIIQLVSKDGLYLDPVTIYHPDPAFEEHVRGLYASIRQSVNKGFALRVFQTQQALLIPSMTIEQIRGVIEPRFWPLLEVHAIHSLIIAPMRSQGRIIGLLSIVRIQPNSPYSADDRDFLQDLADRTALALTNARLFSDGQAYVARLEQSNRDLQEFAYVASHDLQEPLRKVLAFSDRITKKYGDTLDETGRDYLKRMQGAGQRMQTLVNDLLTFSHVSTQSLPFMEVNLNTLAEEVVSDLENQIERTRGCIEIGELLTIEADPTQMHQLLQNLITNALKFHHEDRPPIVKISATINGNVCQISVEDNGIGFDIQYLNRIFKPFQRLHNRLEYEGSGMGLAICRRIVERHGGMITATSTPGNGSTFVVTLPIHQSKGGSTLV